MRRATQRLRRVPVGAAVRHQHLDAVAVGTSVGRRQPAVVWIGDLAERRIDDTNLGIVRVLDGALDGVVALREAIEAWLFEESKKSNRHITN